MKRKLFRVLLLLTVVASMLGKAIISVPAYAAGTWTPTSVTPSRLWSVWGSSPTNVFGVGQISATGPSSGTILSYDGSSWSTMSTSTANPSHDNLYGVWGSSSADVFAVGQSGIVLHFDGNVWSSMTSTVTTLTGVWGTSPTNVYAVGGNGVYHYNGSTWSSVNSTASLQAIWGSSASDIFAVGTAGVIIHYNGSGWSAMTSPTTNDLTSVWGSSPSNVFAVSPGGNLLQYDGISWTDIKSTANLVPDGLYGIWGSSASDIFAVGSGILHFNGTSWSRVYPASSSIPPCLSAWGSSPSDVFAVGYSNTVYHYPGPSDDATLSNLTISSGTLTPAFAFGTTSYTDSVANAVSSITVTPTVTESHATIKVNDNTVTNGTPSGSISLNFGYNIVSVVVTAQDTTTTKTYTVWVTRVAPPAVVTLAASNVAVVTATLNGNLTDPGSANPARVYFQWGVNPVFTNTTANDYPSIPVTFTANITGLTANTTYIYRAVAVGDGTTWGANITFTTTVVIPGDANGDGDVNAGDITRVEREIAHLEAATPGADANGDGKINAGDITKVERIIVHLP